MVRLLLAGLSTLALVACGNGGNRPAAGIDDDAAATAATAAPEMRPVGPEHEDETGDHPHGDGSGDDSAGHFDLASVPGSLDLTGADLANGRREFRRCQSCHTINEGGRPTVGPNLYGVVGRPAASTDGFSYSPALSQSGLIWTSDTLNTWIENPRAMVANNRMSFVGLRDAEDRRDVIAYLASLTDSDD